eukprot:m.45610 g.45610  ORF g.45610 m.45610 type:complete len:313 (+) comp20008_c1_seq1:112-1050(+)
MGSPKDTYDSMVIASTQKILTPWKIQGVQGFMAGAYVALGALFANRVEAEFAASAEFYVFGGLLGGMVFPVGLIAIYLTGANLYTGNCMYVVPPLLSGVFAGSDGEAKSKMQVRLRALLYLLFSWVCNYAGAWFTVYFIAYLGDWTSDETTKTFVMANAVKKCNLDWGVAVMRGVGANWLVCLAWWQALSATDTFSRMAAVWLPVFTFTAIGFEHSIANMFYIQIGWIHGAKITFFEVFFRNLLPVTIGNFLGGAVFLGLIPYMSYTHPTTTSNTSTRRDDLYENSNDGNGSLSDVSLLVSSTEKTKRTRVN